ncbi:MAG: indolepyruvate ferredoxin oxidoreductase subunit alpha [Eubacteriales bacterium]|nr:indolepyruvate ferredoxin oxidoreductase subunit alpha [Eubacteriales bacterium]
MHTEFLMGNEAIALGALAAGVDVCAGYPGTPSTEILETIAKRNPGNVYVEWSVNEKSGMEVAAGAAYTGARALVTMKQVGLNVASDPLMSLEYVGVKGGMVVVTADDPGPISSQTEQDTRTFGMFSKVPVFDPSTVQEAYEMVQEAFELSEKYHTPIFLRPTTRIDHGYASISVKEPSEYKRTNPEGFVKDASRWVIFPRLSVRNHAAIEARNRELSAVFSDYDRNFIKEDTLDQSACEAKLNPSHKRLGIATHGVNYAYVMDACQDLFGEEAHPNLLRVATPFPFPEELALKFLRGLDEVLCVEELDPVIERALIQIAGKYHLPVVIRGKQTGDVKPSGENTVDSVKENLRSFLEKYEAGTKAPSNPSEDLENAENPKPALPVRPPVLCAGCPHRASFYAVKEAMKGKKTIYCGDIGCYTLGNAHPLDMTDTCLCMGAGINIAQGAARIEPDTYAFAFVGDSTFFAAGLTGTVNAFFNQANMTLVVLDNSTTAMTGHQPHPGTGSTLMGKSVKPVSIEKVLRAIGLETVEIVDPLDHEKSVETVKRVSEEPGVKAIIFRSPCIVRFKPKGPKSKINPDLCIACHKCIRELGCPALILEDAEALEPGAKPKAKIDVSLCTGCTLCEQICPVHAISGGAKNE